MKDKYNLISKLEKINYIKEININENKLNKYIDESYDFFKDYKLSNDLLCSLVLINVYYRFHNMESIFYEAIKNTILYIEYDSTYNICKRYYNKEISKYDAGEFFIGTNDIDFENKIHNEEYRIAIIGHIFNNELLDQTEFFSKLIHELNHSVSSIENNYKFTNDSFIIRSGITKEIYIDNKNKMIENEMLNEFYNEYFTEQITNEILQYKKYNIKNNYVLDKLNTLSNTKYYSDNYYDLKCISYPLLKNLELTKLIEDVFYTGNIIKIEEYFNNKNINFKEYSSKLDKIYTKSNINDIKYIINSNKKIGCNNQ